MKKLLIFLLLITNVTCFGQTRPHWLDIKSKPVFDIREYGAKADDSNDDGVAINAAILAAYADKGGTVYIPKGVFIASTTIVLPATYPVLIEGAGIGLTTLRATGNGESGLSAVNPTGGTQLVGGGVRGLTISGNGTNSNVGLHLGNVTRCSFENIYITGFKVGIAIKSAWGNHFEDIHVALCREQALLTETDANATVFTNCEFFASTSATNVLITGGRALSFVGCAIEAGDIGVQIFPLASARVDSITFDKCYFEGNTTNDIVIGEADLDPVAINGVNIKNSVFYAISGTATTSIDIYGGSAITVEDCQFLNGNADYTRAIFVAPGATTSKLTFNRLLDSAGNLIESTKLYSKPDAQLPRAYGRIWYNASGTVSLVRSYNMASVSEPASGSYLLTFTQAMSDAAYLVLASAENGASYTAMFASPIVVSSSTFIIQTSSEVASAPARTINFAVFDF